MSSADSLGSDAPREPDGEEAEALLAEFLGRQERGEDVDFDSFCARHREAAAELHALHEGWLRLRPVMDRLDLTVTAKIRYSEAPRGDPGKSAAEADSSSEILRRLEDRKGAFGRYRMEGEVARGGMGAILRVWDEDLRRNLAMKVILGQGEAPSTGDTPEIDPSTLARFLEEAQVTGQLDHPGIVPVHELGLDASGRVYFTMHLVRGRDLREIFQLLHDEREGWTQTRALNVLLKVCEAMAYAHSKGVVHRDLKPGNIMVGHYGEVYVMDWGLARVLDREETRDVRPQTLRTECEDGETPLLTKEGRVVGTPSYMPPEQADARAGEIGPHSDVYAIGAILYHLLTGRVPFVAPGKPTTARAVLALLRQGPPQPAHGLAPHVPAELIAICERGMARNPVQRYASMEVLAEDLRNYLEGRVVRAYQTGALAELRKWVARNRAIAATVAAAVLGVVSLTAFFVHRIQSERTSAVDAAGTLARGMTQIGDMRGARQVLIDTLPTVERYLPADEVWEFRGNLALARLEAGELKEGQALIQEVHDYQLRTLDDDDPKLQKTRTNLAVARRRSGDLEGALELLEAALTVRERTLAPDDPLLLDTYLNVANVLQNMKRYDEAQTVYEDYIATLVNGGAPPDDKDLLQARGNVAALFGMQGMLREALEIQREVLAGLEPQVLPEHPSVLRARSHLSLTLRNLRQFAEARELLEENVAVYRRLPDERPRLFAALIGLTETLGKLGRSQEAQAVLEELLAVQSQSLSADDPAFLKTKLGLAETLVEQEDQDRAIELLEEVLELSSGPLSEHLRLQEARSLRAEIHVVRGELEEARNLQEEVLEIFERTLPQDHLNLQLARANLALVLKDLGELGEARKLEEGVLEVFESRLPSDHPFVQEARTNLDDTRTRLRESGGDQ